nr:hypothetical protein [Tanacetum cinerariifolium]
MVDKQEITYTVEMFCTSLKLPVETPEQPFIPPADFDYIQPFLKIIGYQGPLQRYPQFTKLIIVDLIEKYESIPESLEEEYHTIKDDTLLERDDIIEATQLSLALEKTTKVYEDQQNVAVVKKKILEEDVEKLVEGEDETDGDECDNIVLLSDEDSD